MNKIELTGILTACVFAILGFSESGAVAFTGTVIFAIIAATGFIVCEGNRRKNFKRARKALIRKMAGI